jgi:hypothetical protein
VALGDDLVGVDALQVDAGKEPARRRRRAPALASSGSRVSARSAGVICDCTSSVQSIPRGP